MKYGNTTYTVNVHFSDKFNAMFEDQLRHHRTIVSAAFAQSFAPSVQL